MNQTGKEKNDNIIVASTILAGAQIVVRIISLLYRIPLIRIVGQEGMGYYANAYEVYQFLLLVSSNGYRWPSRFWAHPTCKKRI